MTYEQIMRVFDREVRKRDESECSISRMAGLGATTINHWRNGETAPTMKLFIDALDVLGIEIVLRRKKTC